MDEPTDLPPPEPVAWQGARACRDALEQVLRALAAPPMPGPGGQPNGAMMQVVCIDQHFADWPLDESAVLQALGTWLRRPGRRLCLLAMDYPATALALPRFARWRRDHAHCIDAWRPLEGGLPAGLRGLMAGGLALQWQDLPALQLRSVTNPVQLAQLRARTADFLQRCEPAWPVTTLGL